MPSGGGWPGEEVNPLRCPSRGQAAVRVGEAAQVVVIKLNLRKLARAGRAFRKLDGAGLVRFAGGARIGPERAAQVADEAVRVLKELVVKLDPDRVAGLAGEIFAAAKSANSRKTRFRVFGLLASIVKETSRAFKSVAGNLSMRDVAIVALVVLTTAPELLVALGVSAAVIRVMVSLAGVLVELFPDRKGAGGIGAEGRPTGLPEPEGELG